MTIQDKIYLIKHSNIGFFILLLLALVALFSPIFPALYHHWFMYNNNSHGILVPFISLYLVWINRRSIDSNKAQTSYTGLGILLLSLFFYIIGYAGKIEVISRLAFVNAILGLVLYNYGWKIFMPIFFPLLFLYFMVPVPVAVENIVSFRLQLWVTQVSSMILRILSISVFMEGNILHFANCSLEVAEACSGIRSLTAYIMLGFLFGYMMHGSCLKRSTMVFLAIPLALIVNIIRVVGTGLLANYFGPEIALGFIHEFSGIAVFLLGLLLFFIIFNLMNEKGNPQRDK